MSSDDDAEDFEWVYYSEEVCAKCPDSEKNEA